MNKLKIAYFGSPDFSANFLEKILTDTSMYRSIEVKFVVTQPDKKVGRKQILTPTPVRIIAEKYKIINNVSFPRGRESSLDLALVYAYGNLIPKELLSLPKYGFWNIHPSLLPKYRGTSPIATPLINGDKTTGVTIIKMDEEIDHGSIIAQENYTIKDTDYRTDLEKNLTDLAFKMFRKLILKDEDTFFETIVRAPLGGVAVEKNGIEALVEQNHSDATYTKKLSKQDGFIEFDKLKNLLNQKGLDSRLRGNDSLATFYNLFRGLHPWPGIWTLLPNRKRLKILDLELYDFKDFTTLRLKKVQLEGKNEVDFITFNKVYKIF